MNTIKYEDLKILDKYYKVPSNIESFKKLSKSLDKKYGVGFQLDCSKLDYFSKPLLKAYQALNRNPSFFFKSNPFSITRRNTKKEISVINFLDLATVNIDFKEALIFKRRVRAARLRKAKQRKK